jgi:hypothetical protein
MFMMKKLMDQQAEINKLVEALEQSSMILDKDDINEHINLKEEVNTLKIAKLSRDVHINKLKMMRELLYLELNELYCVLKRIDIYKLNLPDFKLYELSPFSLKGNIYSDDINLLRRIGTKQARGLDSTEMILNRIEGENCLNCDTSHSSVI